MQLNEKGYYLAVLVLGLYAAISLQKTVRDRAEDIPVSNLYYMISWSALIISILLITIGLWNATLLLSEKGFYALSFTMSAFAVITVQKNIRDMQNAQNAQQQIFSTYQNDMDENKVE
ncbi:MULTISPECIES: inner membrane protein YiaA [unclassified Acinetobacter]|uniref:inner membrane protein YiaA n=1 Tax=unclassified Acinetobacter TaxID=196816 RepID=UPI0035BAFD45